MWPFTKSPPAIGVAEAIGNPKEYVKSRRKYYDELERIQRIQKMPMYDPATMMAASNAILGGSPSLYPSGIPTHHVPDGPPMNYASNHQVQRIQSRMQWQKWPDALFVYKGADAYHIFIASNGKAVTLTDDPLMFPSDQLVGKLRLVHQES